MWHQLEKDFHEGKPELVEVEQATTASTVNQCQCVD